MNEVGDRTESLACPKARSSPVKDFAKTVAKWPDVVGKAEGRTLVQHRLVGCRNTKVGECDAVQVVGRAKAYRWSLQILG